jgi:hypothetical protein
MDMDRANLVCERYGLQLAQILFATEHASVKVALQENGKVTLKICSFNVAH